MVTRLSECELCPLKTGFYSFTGFQRCQHHSGCKSCIACIWLGAATENKWLTWRLFIHLRSLHSRALGTPTLICLIIILHFTTTQLINKMLVHLVSRLNLSAVMKAESLVLMQTFIRSVPWWLGKMHLVSDKLIKYCSVIKNEVYLMLSSSSCGYAAWLGSLTIDWKTSFDWLQL